MAKIRKTTLVALLCIVAICMGVFTLASCGKATVTFNIDGKTEEVAVVDGKVEKMPANPTKDFYEFRGWYTTSTFDEGTEFTKDTEVKGDITVYAYFVEIPVDIKVNSGDAVEIKLHELAAKTEEFKKDAASKSLTFDGWYIDAAYTTAYTNQKTDNLYARYVALVQFDNGHEILSDFTAKVVVGGKVAQPAAKDIATYYMAKEDISFIGADGKPFDFNKSISANTTVTVLWKTPGLKYVEKANGNYAVNGYENDDLQYATREFPALSFLSKVTVGGKPVVVESLLGVPIFGEHCKTILIADGYKDVAGISNSVNIEKVSMPDSVEILVGCYNGFPKMTSFDMPASLKVVIDCFWKNNFNAYVEMYDFDIAIPDTVINLSSVPTNLAFGAESVFFREDDRIFQNRGDGVYLVADYHMTDGIITVPDKVGVKPIVGIQVGAFKYAKNVEIISLPATWTKVGYNESIETFTYYEGTMLYQPGFEESPTSSTMDAEAFAVITGLEEMKNVYIRSTAYPAEMSVFAIVGGRYSPIEFTNARYAGKVLFIGEVEKGESIVVEIEVVNSILNKSNRVTLDGKKSGETLTLAELIAAAKLDSMGYPYTIKSTTVIDKDFKDGVVTTNQYIRLVYLIAAEGYTYEQNTDGTLTVTGFNKDTAVKLKESGLYLVIIPDEFNGKKIVAIKEGAFMGNEDISLVYIGANVKNVGANAFKNAANIKEVRFSDFGLLENIGKSAFENIGASVGADGKVKANGETIIQVPISNLKTLDPYAFKSPAIHKFIPVASEAERYLFKPWDFNASPAFVNPDIGEGDFFYLWGDNFSDPMESGYYGIAEYVKVTVVDMPVGVDPATKQPKPETTPVKLFDVKYRATSGNPEFWGAGGYFCLGFANRQSPFWGYPDVAMRWEMMEGSVYFRESGGTNGISFGLVSKIHQNAFTDIEGGDNAYVYYVETEGCYDKWITMDQVKNQDPEIFDEGWWCGQANSTLEWMKNPEMNETNRQQN